MSINVIIVDNQRDDPAVINMQDWIRDKFHGSTPIVIDDIQFDPSIINKYKPEIVILDLALKEEEHAYLDEVASDKRDYDYGYPLSGFEYCQRLKSYYSNLPVILSSKFFHNDILTKSLELGADGFLYKFALNEETFLSALEETFYRYKTADIEFYRKIRELLNNRQYEPWGRNYVLRACESFFSRGSQQRRLTGLWSDLSILLDDILPASITHDLLKTLIDAESLLIAANPGMRDHVCHAGNVFWLGYYLINSIDSFRSPENLPGYDSQTFAGSSLSSFEQINKVWILSSLLHDIGYITEKISQVEARVERIKKQFGLPGGTVSSVFNYGDSKTIEKLKPFFEPMGPAAQRLFAMIMKTITSLGETTENDKIIIDHGIFSAIALLRAVENNFDAKPNSPEIFHSAASIALHNLTQWNRDWPDPAGAVKLPIGLLPCSWLLSYCDELQGWGREPTDDPFDISDTSDLNEARSKQKEAYIEGSRITSFNISDSPDTILRTHVQIGIQHKMIYGTNPEDTARSVRRGISDWSWKRVNLLKETLSLDDLLKTTITHLIPEPDIDPYIITLHS